MNLTSLHIKREMGLDQEACYQSCDHSSLKSVHQSKQNRRKPKKDIYISSIFGQHHSASSRPAKCNLVSETDIFGAECRKREYAWRSRSPRWQHIGLLGAFPVRVQRAKDMLVKASDQYPTVQPG